MSERVRYVETTHSVENQPTPLEDYDAFTLDRPLVEAVAREARPWVSTHLSSYGPAVGSVQTQRWATQANQSPPVLKTHDRYGHRIDEVEFHPAYHALMKQAMAHGAHSIAWTAEEPGGHVAHAGMAYLHAQAEPGTGCPLTMTHAVVPSLRVVPEIAAEWEPRILSNHYDERALPAAEKRSATFGMAMTEKQGGSDVRANTTRARALSRRGPGEPYALTGHKWFCSAPMSDGFLSLAQTEGGLSCFLVPRFLPDGSRNRFFLQRLKDKLGNRSNASSEVEFDGTWARLLGDEGRGVPTIIQMVAQTRVDCAAGSAGLMRAAIVQAVHHARQRRAFGKLLIDQPLMQRVLADLALELEGAVALTFRVARGHDAKDDAEERALARVTTAIAKYWVTKRAPGVAMEAMECLGGAGYVEESGMPRIYRETPVNSIWEGSGNVQCLDVLRALGRESDAHDALFAELTRAEGVHPRYDEHLARLRVALSRRDELETSARKLVEDLALALAAGVLLRNGPSHVAEAFVATRLGEARGFEYGAFTADVAAKALLERVLPPV